MLYVGNAQRLHIVACEYFTELENAQGVQTFANADNFENKARILAINVSFLNPMVDPICTVSTAATELRSLVSEYQATTWR